MNLGALFLNHVDFGAAFAEGLLTFFSPCVLPLVPAWLALVTGLSFDELAAEGRRGPAWTGALFWPTLLFVLGFVAVFASLGAAAGFLGDLLRSHARLLRWVTGALMIFFGCCLAGFVSPAFLMRERRAEMTRRPLGLAGSFAAGLVFAAGWTPCVGPALASILALAAAESSAGQGAGLLAVYGLGLGLPFLALASAWGAGLTFLARIRPLARRAGQVMGAGLIIMGLLVLTGIIDRVTALPSFLTGS
ncbi:cytochrome C biogenesis protein CcdA [Deltaproteobacteria bacterium]|nr:cytochrome C biogenesis protein CcdA [Deltaproteobacteria bacterium]